MKRLDFLKMAGLTVVSVVGGVTLVPKKSLANAMEAAASDPYKIYGASERFQVLANHYRPGKAITSYLEEKGEIPRGSGNFLAGVGKNGVVEPRIQRASFRKTPTSPVTKITKPSKGYNEPVLQTLKAHNYLDDLVVLGNSGSPFFTDAEFSQYIMKKEWWCYGLPIENTVYHRCSLCGETYMSQTFEYSGNYAKRDKYRIIRNGRGCSSAYSRNGNHDNLFLSPVKPCGDPQVEPTDCHGDMLRR